MKSTFIKTGLVMAFAIVLGTTGYGQIAQQYKAEIPFDFQVGERAYNAGEYMVGPLSDNSNSGAVALLDRSNGSKRIIGSTLLGTDSRTRPARLQFVKINGTYSLERVTTRTFELKMKTPRSDDRMAKTSSDKSERVSVPLGQ